MHGWGMILEILVALLQILWAFPEKIPEPRELSHIP